MPEFNNSNQEYADWIFENFYVLMHMMEPNNFDGERFPIEKKNSFDVKHHANFMKYFMENINFLKETRNQLCDHRSQELFDHLILYRLLGHHHVLLPTNTPLHWQLREKANTFKISDYAKEGALGKLGIYHIETDNKQRFKFIGCSANIAWTFLIKQYYLNQPNVVIQPELGDFVIDAGACFGDTTLYFASSVGKDGHVFSFEMLPANLKILKENMELNQDYTNFTLLPFGVHRNSNTLNESSAVQSGVNPRAILFNDLDKYPVRSIDDLVNNGTIPKIDFIKMDIEGSELAALEGSANSIRKFKPKLAIAIYHSYEDYHTIPKLLKKLVPEYKFYLDHYTIFDEETILYAKV